MFKIATYNANSIRVRMDLILDWLKKETPDVLCIQETKVQDKDFPETPVRDAGYHVVFRGQKSYAGVAVLSREKPEEVACGFDDGGQPDEARLIRATVNGIKIINTYVPQGREHGSEYFQYKLTWFGRLKALFEKHYTPNDLLVWVGDFNVAVEPIDVYDPARLEGHVDYCPEVRAALENVRRWGFVDVFRRHHPGEPGLYSYYDYRAQHPVKRGTGWRVDHIWATASLAAKSVNAWIDVKPRLANRPSDHTFMVAEFRI